MNTRTPPVHQSQLPTATESRANELSILNADGIDTRLYRSLTHAQQIEWLEVNSCRLQEYYLAMTAALAKLKAEQTKEVRP